MEYFQEGELLPTESTLTMLEKTWASEHMCTTELICRVAATKDCALLPCIFKIGNPDNWSLTEFLL